MCGIFGFSKSSEFTRRMTGPLAIAMEMRGHDSWGVTDGDFVFKEAKPITEGFCELDLDGPIYHTRAASCGAISDRNAHPFDVTGSTGKRIVGIHNGHISNWSVLKDTYKRKDIQVDSEHIFHHLAEGISLRDIHGWGAVAWFETVNGKTRRFLSKFGAMDNLHVMQLVDGTLVFASTAIAIQVAARFADIKIEKTYNVKENVLYEMVDGKLMNGGALDWGEDRPSYTSSTSTRVHYSGSAICAVPSCNKTVLTDQFICTKCLEETLVEYGLKMVKA